MLRDKSLIPLSHQHQHALALCVRIERASPIPAADVAAWQNEIAQIFQSEIHVHFVAEEQVVFPAARKFDELQEIVSELIAEHAELRAKFALALRQNLASADVLALGRQLSAHIRKEERQLFERMQQLLGADGLVSLGRELDLALTGDQNPHPVAENATRVGHPQETCLLPSEITRLRARK